MRRTKSEVFSNLESAREIFRVSMLRGAATRALPKAYLISLLDDPEIYSEFLKLCMEQDKSDDLRMTRKGLLMIVKRLGVSRIAKGARINRVTLYRILSPSGNPSLKNLIALLKAIGIRLWMVDAGFVEIRQQIFDRNKEYPDWMPLSVVKKLRSRKFR